MERDNIIEELKRDNKKIKTSLNIMYSMFFIASLSWIYDRFNLATWIRVGIYIVFFIALIFLCKQLIDLYKHNKDRRGGAKRKGDVGKKEGGGVKE